MHSLPTPRCCVLPREYYGSCVLSANLRQQSAHFLHGETRTTVLLYTHVVPVFVLWSTTLFSVLFLYNYHQRHTRRGEHNLVIFTTGSGEHGEL